jgi:hypothetical protein
MACLVLNACATTTGLREELERSVKAYNRLLRWHELENAVITYSAPDKREVMLKQVDTLKKRGLSITDYRILTMRYLPEKNTGDVVAEFDYYILPSNRVKTISSRQEWVYRDQEKIWKVESDLPVFE